MGLGDVGALGGGGLLRLGAVLGHVVAGVRRLGGRGRPVHGPCHGLRGLHGRVALLGVMRRERRLGGGWGLLRLRMAWGQVR